MATYNKFNVFVGDLSKKVHNLNADTLKIMLVNTAPVATNSIKTDLTDITAANGYTAGGTAVATNSIDTATAGTAKLIGNAVTFLAAGGTIGPFRYAVLWNDTPTSPLDPLIGWWDYGSSVTLNDGESFKVAKDTSGNNWDTTTPLLSIT